MGLAGYIFLVGSFLAFFLLQARLLGVQPIGVVALVRDAAAAVEFKDPAGGVVKKVAIMGNGDDRSREIVEKTLQPGNTLLSTGSLAAPIMVCLAIFFFSSSLSTESEKKGVLGGVCCTGS